MNLCLSNCPFLHLKRGLLGDNPLLGETRPNTTSLISLLRPCCFVATESHAQLSAAALSPWWRRVPPIVNGHLHCPLIDFTESGSDSTLYLQSDTLWVSAVSVSSCPLEVLRFTANRRQSWSRQEWFWHFLSPHSRSTPWGSGRQCRRFERSSIYCQVCFHREIATIQIH